MNGRNRVTSSAFLIGICVLAICALECCGSFMGLAQTTLPPLPEKFMLPTSAIELTRTARPHAYFEAVGQKAGVLGQESGVFESWIFPLKLFHDARFSIRVEGVDSPVDFSNCVERIVVRPESSTLIASNQLFTIRANFFTPIDAAGSIILLDIDTTRSLTLTFSFLPDLKPMWPGGLGGQSAGWREDIKAFVISESRRKYNGIVGSPAAIRGISTPAHQLAAGALRFDMPIDPNMARRCFYPIVIAGGSQGRQPVLDLYNQLLANIPQQYRMTREHYRRIVDDHLAIETPDQNLNLAFQWAKVALDKGLVNNPDLGLGWVAGWAPAGNGARPGFGWFFGGDAAINSYALTATGDFETVSAVFRFLAKYQRADGKIPHEISQSAGMIPWFDEYPYAYYHADTTPFFIAAFYNLFRQSGDRQMVAELWDPLVKAYQFCTANDSDGDGILENSKAGLGASELGSLLANLHQDILLAAIHTEASQGMSDMAKFIGNRQLQDTAQENHQRARQAVHERYWNEAAQRYAYALTKERSQNMELTAWTALPMVFGQVNSASGKAALKYLASAQLSTDWGTRMLSNASTAYDPIAYNNGGVWPFLTGFVALGEYKYNRPHSAFAHLNQLAALTFDHGLGYHPEILSGDYYCPLDESVPHQLFSSGMIITPLVRGLLGLEADAAGRKLRIAPQLPVAWDRLQSRNYRLGEMRISMDLRRPNARSFVFDFAKSDDVPLALEISAALPAFAKIAKVLVGEKAAAYETQRQEAAVFCVLATELRKQASIEIHYSGGLELEIPFEKPKLGDTTSALKVLEVAARSDSQLFAQVEGLAGRKYILRARGEAKIADIQGGHMLREEGVWKWIEVTIPAANSTSQYVTHQLILQLQ